jgi:hypothetical protein
MTHDISDAQPGLFGWVPAPARAQGRPAYEWSKEKSNKVMCLFAGGHRVKDAAAVMCCDQKTFRKVFSHEVRYRDIALLVIRSGMMAALVAEAEGGNVGAIKQLDKMLTAERMKTASADFGKVPDQAVTKKGGTAKAKGLKEQRRDNAHFAGQGDDDWGNLLHGNIPPGTVPS